MPTPESLKRIAEAEQEMTAAKDRLLAFTERLSRSATADERRRHRELVDELAVAQGRFLKAITDAAEESGR